MNGLNGIHSPREKLKTRFSIRIRLLLVFGVLIVMSVFALGSLSIIIARKAVKEKIVTHLNDKAEDIADILDGRIRDFFHFVEVVSRNPILQDKDVPLKEKTAYLKKRQVLIMIFRHLP